MIRPLTLHRLRLSDASMSEHAKPLVGSIFERAPRSSASPPSPSKSVGSNRGFPVAQHRSKSVFARSREAQGQLGAHPLRVTEPPVVQPTPIIQKHVSSEGSEGDNWRAQISEENERRVASMTEQERMEAQREIEEKFGKNIGEVLKRARMAREADKGQTEPIASLEEDLAGGLLNDSRIAQPLPPSAYNITMHQIHGSDTLKASRVVPVGTPVHLAFLLYANADLHLRRTGGRTVFPATNYFQGQHAAFHPSPSESQTALCGSHSR